MVEPVSQGFSDAVRKIMLERVLAAQLDAIQHDPNNPWPPGSDWHRRHDQIYRDQRRRHFTHD